VTINDETNALYPHNSAGPDSQTQVWQYICLSGTTLHFFLYFAFLRWVLPDQGMILFLLYFFNDFLNLLAAEIPSGAEAIHTHVYTHVRLHRIVTSIMGNFLTPSLQETIR